MLFVFLPNACKPDMILASIYVEQTLSESESECKMKIFIMLIISHYILWTPIALEGMIIGITTYNVD